MPLHSAEDFHREIAWAWRTAADHPELGPQIRDLDLVIQLFSTEPEARMVVRLQDPVRVEEDAVADDAELVIRLTGDIADRYWQGEYNLAVGVAQGHLGVEGPIERLLALVPLTRPVFPAYRARRATRLAGGEPACHGRD